MSASNVVNWRRNLALTLGLGALSFTVLWYEFSYKDRRQETDEASKKLVNLKAEPLAELAIADGKKRVVLSCADVAAKLCKPGENSKWDLLEPLRTKADDNNANALLSAVQNVTATDAIDLAQDSAEKRALLLADYRLDERSRKRPQALSARFKFASGKTVELHFGDTHPVGENFFAAITRDGKFEDHRVYLLPTYFKTNFERDLGYWRDKRVTSLTAAEVLSFRLESSKTKLSAKRTENQPGGAWLLSGRDTKGGIARNDVPGDADAIDGLLNALGFLNAKGFPPASDLAGAKKSVTIETTTKAARQFSFFEKKKGTQSRHFLRVSGQDPVYEIDPASRDRFDKALKDLRNTRLIGPTERFGLKRIEIEGPEIGPEPWSIVQADGKWQTRLATGKLEPVNHSKVQAMLDRLSGNRIKEFLPSAKATRLSPKDAITLKCYGDSATPLRTLAFWRGKAKELFAQAQGDEVWLVDSSVTDSLPWTRESLKP